MVIFTSFVYLATQPLANLVTPLKGNGCHRRELRDPISPCGYPVLYIKNVLCRDDGIAGVQGEARLWGVFELAGSPRQHYAVYDHVVAKCPPYNERHDPRYDLVKKPFNVSIARFHSRLPEKSTWEVYSPTRSETRDHPWHCGWPTTLIFLRFRSLALHKGVLSNKVLPWPRLAYLLCTTCL